MPRPDEAEPLSEEQIAALWTERVDSLERSQLPLSIGVTVNVAHVRTMVAALRAERAKVERLEAALRNVLTRGSIIDPFTEAEARAALSPAEAQPGTCVCGHWHSSHPKGQCEHSAAGYACTCKVYVASPEAQEVKR